MNIKELDDMNTEEFIDLLFKNCEMKTNMVEEVKPKHFKRLIWKNRLSNLWLHIKFIVDLSILVFAMYHVIMFIFTENMYDGIMGIIFTMMALNTNKK